MGRYSRIKRKLIGQYIQECLNLKTIKRKLLVPVQPLGPLPKACHKVKPECEHQLYCALLETGMCVLVAEKVPRDEAGRPLVGGYLRYYIKPM